MERQSDRQTGVAETRKERWVVCVGGGGGGGGEVETERQRRKTENPCLGVAVDQKHFSDTCRRTFPREVF